MSLRDYLFHEEPGITLYCGDCREVLPLLVEDRCTSYCMEECSGPLSVISDLVSRCPVDGTVLDPFLGSGTTFRTAKDHNRKAIGIEIEPKYCEIAVKRLRQEVLL